MNLFILKTLRKIADAKRLLFLLPNIKNVRINTEFQHDPKALRKNKPTFAHSKDVRESSHKGQV
jgi:hypothetical protein